MSNEPELLSEVLARVLEALTSIDERASRMEEKLSSIEQKLSNVGRVLCSGETAEPAETTESNGEEDHPRDTLRASEASSHSKEA